jgi:hypothetical protein
VEALALFVQAVPQQSKTGSRRRKQAFVEEACELFLWIVPKDDSNTRVLCVDVLELVFQPIRNHVCLLILAPRQIACNALQEKCRQLQANRMPNIGQRREWHILVSFIVTFVPFSQRYAILLLIKQALRRL